MNKVASLIKKFVFPQAKPVVIEASSSSNTIAIILGWGGSGPWNFKRIQNHYNERNVTTIQFTMPLILPKFVRSSFESDVGQTLKEQIEKIETSSKGVKPRVLLHSYSNNGAWAFSNLLKDNKLAIIPEKIILDSSPWFTYKRDVPFESVILSQLFTSILLGRPEYYHFPFTPIARMGAGILLTLSLITDKIIPFKYYFFLNYFDMHAYLRDNYPCVPTLFICSSGDKLVPPKQIEPFRKVLEERQVPMEVHEFGDDVPHVSSMFKYTEEYCKLVDKFFDLSPIKKE